MEWLNNSEIVMGFVFRGKLDPHTINADDLHPPYNEALATARDADNLNSLKETVIQKHGYSIYRDAVEASESINSGTTPLNWVKIMETTASKFRVGVDLSRIGNELQTNHDVDLGKILQNVSQLELGYRSMTPLSEVEPEKHSLTPTGYKPIDDYFGGIPKSGLTIIAAPPGIGKTFLMLKMGLCMLRVKANKKKKIGIFSLEMLMSQLVKRYIDMDKKITTEERSRILASESAYNMSEVYAVAARTAASEKLAMIGIDFADLLVEGEQSESVMGSIYRASAVLAKQTRVPVVLLCQLSRNYTGGTPRVNHIRYSGMAEAMSSLIFLLHNPNNLLADFGKTQETSLPAVEGRGYIIGGKARFGFTEGGPGAIQVAWDGAAGWGDTVYGGYIKLTQG